MSLSEVLKQLYVVGGIPLVFVFIGAANIFVPYDNSQRWVVSIAVMMIGAMSWGVTVYIGIVRWKMQAQALAEQNALVLRAVCDIAVKLDDTPAVEKRVKALRKALKDADDVSPEQAHPPRVDASHGTGPSKPI